MPAAGSAGRVVVDVDAVVRALKRQKGGACYAFGMLGAVVAAVGAVIWAKPSW
jgi:hypothetical protein